jgi:hypothetical protein
VILLLLAGSIVEKSSKFVQMRREAEQEVSINQAGSLSILRQLCRNTASS